MAIRQLANLDFENVARIQNLPDAASAQEPATKAQLDAAVLGLGFKDNVRVKTQSNINLASPGSTIDGITMAADDRVLVGNQTAQPENGIYIWNGAAVPMTRAPDADNFTKLEQAVASVDEGTSANTTWRQTEVNGVIGTNNVVFGAFGTAAPGASETVAGVIEIATQAETNAGAATNLAITPEKLGAWSGRKLKYTTTIGDGSATSYVVTHNLGTRDVDVTIYAAATPYEEAECEVQRTTTNSVTLIFASAPTAGEFQVVVLG